MKVIVADKAGVCYGVKRALKLVENEAASGDSVATLGPLIHNPQVVRKLEEQGVRVVRSVDEVGQGAIVLPSHGVTCEVYEAAEQAGLRIVDATCPYVANVRKKVRSLTSQGYRVVIVGDANHSEVRAIKSAAGEDAIVVSSVDEARNTDWAQKKVGVVSQTTQAPEYFGQIVGIIASSAAKVIAYNTICHATSDRQTAARELAPQVEAVFVVGGRNSANTNRLVEICRSSGVPTYHVETADEICEEWVKGMNVVGLTAGASTPDWIIDEVKRRLERL